MTVIYVSLAIITAGIIVFLINTYDDYVKETTTVITSSEPNVRPQIPLVVFHDRTQRFGTRDIILPKPETPQEPDPPPLKVA